MAKSKAKAETFDLDAIEKALDNASVTEALDAALIAWRQTRAPALAELIDVIASKVEAPAITTDTAWSTAARDRDPAMIGALLAALPLLPASFLPTAGEALAAFADDPRIAMAVARWAIDPMSTASQNYPFWTKSLDAMSRAGDRRVVPLLKKRLKMTPGGSTFWPKFYKGLEKAIAKIEDAPVVTVDDTAIARLVKAAKATRKVAVEVAPAKFAAPSGPVLDGPPLGQAAEHLEARTRPRLPVIP